MNPPCSPNALAAKLSKALISSSSTQKWSPHLEQTLHSLIPRKTLTPFLVSNTIDPYLIHHHSLALGFFNWASQQPNFTHTPQTYHSLLKSLSLSHQFTPLKTLLNQINTLKIDLHPSSYRSLVSSMVFAKKPVDALHLFDKMPQWDIGSNLCNSLLAALSADGYLEFAKRVFDKMVFRGICLSSLGFGVFVGRFCRVVGLDETLGLIDEINKQKIGNVNGSIGAVLIVDGLCRVSRFMDAWRVLEELRVREFKPDFIAYRIVAESFRSMGQLDEAHKVLKQKRKLSVAPRANDYREFIFGLISHRLINEAKELGEVIVSGNFPIEDDVLNALIGSVSAVDPKSAIGFCKFMIERERYPTLFTLSNLCRNLCKSRKTDEMWDVFQVLCSKNYFSDLESYNVMISFLCKAGRVKEAYGVLKEMRKNGFIPDVFFYNSLMEACCKEDLLRPAKRLWDEMFVNGCHANLQTYNTLIRKFSGTGDLEEAQRLFHHMLDKGVVPDSITYTSLIKGLCREAKIDAAYEIFNKSMEQDVMLAGSTLSALIFSLCKEGNFRSASEVMRGLSPDIENSDSHVVLLKSLLDAGEVKMAIGHIEWIRDGSPLKLQAISAQLIASLSSSPNPEPILQLLQAMCERGLVSNNGPWMNLLCKGSSTRC